MKKTAATILIIFTLLILCSCRAGVLTRYTYDDADEYTAGCPAICPSGEIEAQKLDIDWIAGEVEILPHDGSGVKFDESADGNLGDGKQLYYRVKDGVLSIKFAKSGAAVFSEEKKLTVYLPKNCTVSSLAVDTVSADVNMESTGAGTIRIGTISGRVNLTSAADIGELKIDTISGGLQTNLTGKVGELEIKTVSGEIDADAAQVEKYSVDSTSGNVILAFDNTPKDGAVSTVSGSVVVRMPANAGFTMNAETVSGSIRCNYDAERDGDKYVCGAGACRLEAETVSGSITVEKK